MVKISQSNSTASSSFADAGDVDICVTCLTKKPPTLPLREELPSLGVEVIYKAKGKGLWKAKNKARKKVQKYRQETQVHDLTKRRIFPKSKDRIQAKLAERKRLEHELRLPYALSYDNYNHTTSSSASGSGDEDDTLSVSTGMSSAHMSVHSRASAYSTSSSLRRNKETLQGALRRLAYEQQHHHQQQVGASSSATSYSESSRQPSAISSARKHEKDERDQVKVEAEKDVVSHGAIRIYSPSKSSPRDIPSVASMNSNGNNQGSFSIFGFGGSWMKPAATQELDPNRDEEREDTQRPRTGTPPPAKSADYQLPAVLLTPSSSSASSSLMRDQASLESSSVHRSPSTTEWAVHDQNNVVLLPNPSQTSRKAKAPVAVSPGEMKEATSVSKKNQEIKVENLPLSPGGNIAPSTYVSSLPETPSTWATQKGNSAKSPVGSVNTKPDNSWIKQRRPSTTFQPESREIPISPPSVKRYLSPPRREPPAATTVSPRLADNAWIKNDQGSRPLLELQKSPQQTKKDALAHPSGDTPSSWRKQASKNVPASHLTLPGLEKAILPSHLVSQKKRKQSIHGFPIVDESHRGTTVVIHSTGTGDNHDFSSKKTMTHHGFPILERKRANSSIVPPSTVTTNKQGVSNKQQKAKATNLGTEQDENQIHQTLSQELEELSIPETNEGNENSQETPKGEENVQSDSNSDEKKKDSDWRNMFFSSFPMFASKGDRKTEDECKIELPEIHEITECCSSPGTELEEEVKDFVNEKAPNEDVVLRMLHDSPDDAEPVPPTEASKAPSASIDPAHGFHSDSIQDIELRPQNELLEPFPKPADDDSSTPSVIIASENGELSIPSKKNDEASSGSISVKSSMSTDNSAIVTEEKQSDEKEDKLVLRNDDENDAYSGIDVMKEYSFVLDMDPQPGVVFPLKPVEHEHVIDNDEDTIHRLQRELIEKLENQSVQISLSEDERSRNSFLPGEDDSARGNELALLEGQPVQTPGYSFAADADLNPFNPMHSFRMLASTFHGGEALVEHLCEKYAKEQQQYELEGVPNLELEPSWGGDQDAFEDLKGNNSALLASNSFGDASDYASPQNSVDMQEGTTSFDNSEASGEGSASDDNTSDRKTALVLSNQQRSQFALGNLEGTTPFVWDEEKEKQIVIKELEQNGKTVDASMVKAQLLLRKASKLFRARNHQVDTIKETNAERSGGDSSNSDEEAKQKSIEDASLRWKTIASDIFNAPSIDSKESSASSRRSGSVSDTAMGKSSPNSVEKRQLLEGDSTNPFEKSQSHNPFDESDCEDMIEAARGSSSAHLGDKIERAREESERNPFVSEVSDSDSDDCYLDKSILSSKGGNQSIGESIGFESSVAPRGLDFLPDESLAKSEQSQDPQEEKSVESNLQDTPAKTSSEAECSLTTDHSMKLKATTDLAQNSVNQDVLNDAAESKTMVSVNLRSEEDSEEEPAPSQILEEQDDEKSLYSSLGLSSVHGEVSVSSANKELCTTADSAEAVGPRQSAGGEERKLKPMTRFMRMLTRLTGREATEDVVRKEQQKDSHHGEPTLEKAQASTQESAKHSPNVSFPDVLTKPDPSIVDAATVSIKQDPSGAQGLGIANKATDPSGAKDDKCDSNSVDSSQSSVILDPTGTMARSSDEQVEKPTIEASDSEKLDFLLNLLSVGNAKIHEIHRLIGSDLLMAQLKRNKDGRLALHCVCENRLPDRSRHSESSFTAHLLTDIERFQKRIELIKGYFDAACELTDREGDLPAHILARNLMEWETTWYDRIYESAASKSGQSSDSVDAVTKLYKAMSQCMEILLSPIVRQPHLCQEPGSVGTLLPLHMAAIFTSTVDTLRHALETYPLAAITPCDVKNMLTFVPDECVPIELHDHLSTDFPKWEVEESDENGNGDLTWSKTEDCLVSRENAIRRSDLMFVYHPVHRFVNEGRLHRVEARIRIDARQIMNQESQGLTAASKRAWVTFCREGDLYIDSVKRIMAALPLRLVEYLATIRSDDNLTILDLASKETAEVIHARMNELSRNVVSIKSSSDEASFRSWEECQITRLDFGGKRSMAYLTRKLFNIREESIPTSFVILPYELEDLGNGEVGMSSPDALPAAMKFAECLMQITDPRSVLYHLDTKSKELYGHSLYENSTNGAMRERAFKKIEAFESKLIQFYKKGKGYLYLIDEERGVPCVKASDKTYPIVLKKPAPVVKSLLPLMISGMVQMRGDKALTVLAASLLDFNITRPPLHWLSTAQGVSGQLFSKEVVDNVEKDELDEIKESLFDLISNGRFQDTTSLEEGTSNGNEWSSEISVLQKLLETHDDGQKYSGLISIKGKSGVLWCDSHKFDEPSIGGVSGKADDSTEHHNNTEGLRDSSSTVSSDEDVYLTDSENSDAQVVPKPMSFHQPEEHGSGSDQLISNSSTVVSSDDVEKRRQHTSNFSEEKMPSIDDTNKMDPYDVSLMNEIESSVLQGEEIHLSPSVQEESTFESIASPESDFHGDKDDSSELSRSDAAIDIVNSLEESSRSSKAIMTSSIVSMNHELSDVAEESHVEDETSVSSHDTNSAQAYSVESSMQANASVSIMDSQITNDDRSSSSVSDSIESLPVVPSKEPAVDSDEAMPSPRRNEALPADAEGQITPPLKCLNSATSPGGTGSLSYDSMVSFSTGVEDDAGHYGDCFAERIPSYDEIYDPEQDALQVWNAEEGVWENIKHPLDQSENFGSDQKNLGLKLKLFEQAQKLANLHNRMKAAKEEGRRMEESSRERLTGQQERSVRAILQKRKLMMRLCNLEERIISTQIGYQLQGADTLQKSQQVDQPKPESPRIKNRKAKEILQQKKDKLEKARLAWIESLSENGKPVLGKSHSSMSSSNPTFASKKSAFSSTHKMASTSEHESTMTTEPISPGEHASFVTTSPPSLPYRHERSTHEEEWEARPTISTAARIRLASSRHHRSPSSCTYSFEGELPNQTNSYETIDLTNVEEPPFPSHIEVPTGVDAEPILHETRHRLPHVSRSEASYATEDDDSSIPPHKCARKTSDLHDFGFADLFASVIVPDSHRRNTTNHIDKEDNVSDRKARDFYGGGAEDLLDLTNNLESLLARAESSPAFGVALSETMNEFLHP